MHKLAMAAAGVAVVVMSLQANPVFAQGAPQTVGLVKVDPATISTGYRASRIIGSTVVNEGDDNIGRIDDVIISQDGKNPYAVLSVGGFLGIGNHLVVVPYESLRFSADKVMLPAATKDQLKTLPNFEYAK